MAIISAPCIMVSSTYYDLRQIRVDIEQFLSKDLSYIPLLSEYPSFPVDPDKRTIENCRARVNEHADVLVLIIGGRYGHVASDSQKSVTNIEHALSKDATEEEKRIDMTMAIDLTHSDEFNEALGVLLKDIEVGNITLE